MRRLILAIVFALLTASARAEDKLDVRVLYCGDLGSVREADFRMFLEKYFKKITLCGADRFHADDAKDQDVVIFDWTNTYDGKGGFDEAANKKMATVSISLGANFSRPAILVGQMGGHVAIPLKMKIDWLCLCLDGPAHHLNLKHPVFQGPLKVDPEFEEVPTPAEYPYISLDRSLGPTMQAWRVQKKDYPDIDPGLVSDLYGFDDSPDSEVIAQGMAQKGPDTLALGRQANYLLWGFSAQPSDMTPSGQRLFVNVVAYMKQFDGEKPLMQKKSQSRDWALRYASSFRMLKNEYWEMKTRELRESLKKHPEYLPKNIGNAEEYITDTVEQQRKAEERVVPMLFPESLIKKFSKDADKYDAYYRENLEYLIPAGEESLKFLVDEDAKKLDVSNRDVKTLEKCVSLLEANQQADVALRLLKRYTQENFSTAAEWKKWLTENRDRLYFSDTGGYKFFVAPQPDEAASSK
jgi:hypothetical protein